MRKFPSGFAMRYSPSGRCVHAVVGIGGRMSVIQALDVGLALLVLAVAGWTIAAREAFASVVGYVAYGLLLSLVWVRLFAVDVALTEAAISSGVTGVLLISAVVRLRKTEAPAAGERPGVLLRILAAALCA